MPHPLSLYEPDENPIKGLDNRVESCVWHPKNSGSHARQKALHFPGFVHLRPLYAYHCLVLCKAVEEVIRESYASYTRMQHGS